MIEADKIECRRCLMGRQQPFSITRKLAKRVARKRQAITLRRLANAIDERVQDPPANLFRPSLFHSRDRPFVLRQSPATRRCNSASAEGP